MEKNISKLACAFPALRLYGNAMQVECQEIEIKKDGSDSLLDVVYAPDEFTRLPQSDVAVYLSDKVDPMIREFVASNLMSPNPKVDGVPDEYSDICHDLVRGVNESVSDYAVRIRDIVSNDSAIRLKESQVEPSKTEE